MSQLIFQRPGAGVPGPGFLKRKFNMKYTSEEKEIIEKYYPKFGADVCSKIIRLKTGNKRTAESIRGYCARTRTLRTETTFFKKGHTPYNKGVKMPDQLKQKLIEGGSLYKKGNIPFSKKPIGSISTKNGYLYKKLEDGSWKLLHHIVFEQNFGAIPDGHIVIFKDKNPSNTHLSNLICVSRKQSVQINSNREKAGQKMKETWVLRRRSKAIEEHGSIYQAILNGWTPKSK